MKRVRKAWNETVNAWGKLTMLFALVIFIEAFLYIEPIVAQLLN